MPPQYWMPMTATPVPGLRVVFLHASPAGEWVEHSNYQVEYRRLKSPLTLLPICPNDRLKPLEFEVFHTDPVAWRYA